MKNNPKQKFYLLLTLTLIIGFLILYYLFGLLFLTLNHKSFELFGLKITTLAGIARGSGGLWNTIIYLAILIILFIYLINSLYKLKKQKLE